MHILLRNVVVRWLPGKPETLSFLERILPSTSPGINDQSCNVFGVYSGTDRGNDDCVEGKVEV